MKPWSKFLVCTLITLTIGGLYLFFVWKQRQNPGVVSREDASQKLSTVDLAVVRMLFPAHFEDTLRLEGTGIWMKDGYTTAYLPYKGGHVEFSRRVGVIPSAQRLEIKKIIKSTVPAGVDDGMSHGARQVFAVFALPRQTGFYATPIDDPDEFYACDQLFYYDDPHTIYNNWSKDVWAAIDAHKVKPGMSELQTRMAIGQNEQADGSTEGNRTVTYDLAGKHLMVTFVNNRATVVQSE